MSHCRRCPHSHPQLIQRVLPRVSEHRASGHAHTCWHAHMFSTDVFSEPGHPHVLADTQALYGTSLITRS